MSEAPAGGAGPVIIDGYEFDAKAKPLLPGSPATPDHPPRVRAAYIAIGLLFGLAAGLQNGLLNAALPQIQGAYGLTPVEGGWLLVAYNMVGAWVSMLLFKLRQEAGIAPFVRLALCASIFVNGLQLLGSNYEMELVARAFSGLVGSSLTVLGLFYLMQGLPPKARLLALVIGIGMSQLGSPLARAFVPDLIYNGEISRLFALQFGLVLAAFGAMSILRLPPGQTTRVFDRVDLLSFPLYGGGIALLCAVFVQGRIQWWDKAWLGWASAGALILLAGAVWVEKGRRNQMLKLDWLSSGGVIKFALTAIVVRVLLSEQTSGAAGLLGAVGMNNEQLQSFYLMITFASICGMAASIALLNPKDLQLPLMIALALIAWGSFIDVGAGTLSRPRGFFFSQFLIGFASLLFMAPILFQGVIRAIAKGGDYLISFSAIFGLSQSLGGLAGAAGLSAYQTIRTKEHLTAIGDTLQLSDPLVAAAVKAGAQANAPVLTDPQQLMAQGASTLVQQANLQASIAAFNDTFWLVGVAASIALVLMSARWAYDRIRGVNPLEQELKAMQQMMPAQ